MTRYLFSPSNKIITASVWILSAILIITLSLYLYNIKRIVAFSIEKQMIFNENNDKASKVASLESNYIKSKNVLSVAKAKELGFREIEPIFVSKVMGLSLRAEGDSR